MKPWLAARNIGALAARRVARAADRVSGRSARLRRHRRAAREAEQAAFVDAERGILDEIAALARGSRPIVVGPWLSEVGYEALYWVPFVRWFVAEHRVAPERLVVISRGGVASWYRDVAARYHDILDLVPVAEFAERNRARVDDEDGSQKQLGPGALDRDLIARACAAAGVDDPAICHPSLMYRLFRQFWAGNRSLDWVLRHLRFAPPGPEPALALPPLPPRFVAVKLYTGKALPDTAANRAVVRACLERLAADVPVVLLDSPRLDDHADFTVDAAVASLAGAMTPANNLGVQTEVLRRAESFVTTCGGLAWLAPMMGVPTSALYSDDRFLASHLYLARHALRRMPGAATFAPVDLRGVGALVERGSATLR